MNSMTKHPIDVHVGKKMREYRNLSGITQTAIGQKLNISFQQVQKYETGANRVSASKLFEIAQLLDTPVSAFFPDGADDGNELGITGDEAALVRAYRDAPPHIRNAMRALTLSISGEDEDEAA
jgi:transcriptional regulator with XRE-family HTH domain